MCMNDSYLKYLELKWPGILKGSSGNLRKLAYVGNVILQWSSINQDFFLNI